MLRVLAITRFHTTFLFSVQLACMISLCSHPLQLMSYIFRVLRSRSSFMSSLQFHCTVITPPFIRPYNQSTFCATNLNTILPLRPSHLLRICTYRQALPFAPYAYTSSASWSTRVSLPFYHNSQLCHVPSIPHARKRENPRNVLLPS